MSWMKRLGLVGVGEEGDGRALPAFRALSHTGEERGPEDLEGAPAVLWFYPKASTPG